MIDSSENVVSVHFVVTRMGRTGFKGVVFVNYEDESQGQLEKQWRGKTLGFVNTEIHKIKQDFINRGLSKEQITVEYLK